MQPRDEQRPRSLNISFALVKLHGFVWGGFRLARVIRLVPPLSDKFVDRYQ